MVEGTLVVIIYGRCFVFGGFSLLLCGEYACWCVRWVRFCDLVVDLGFVTLFVLYVVYFVGFALGLRCLLRSW